VVQGHPAVFSHGRLIVKRVLYYVRLYAALAAYSLNRELQFRTNFLVLIIGYILYLTANLALFGLLYSWITTLGDWSFAQILIFIGTYHMIHGAWDSTTALNLDRIPQYVGNGELDLLLLKPVSPLFLVVFRGISFPPLINVALGIVLTIAGVVSSGNPPGVCTVCAYLALSINGIIIFTMLQLLVQLTAFKVIRNSMINDVFYNLVKFAEKPDVIFPGAMRLIFTFVFPLLVIVSVPSRLLMGKISLALVLFDLSATCMLVALGIGFWKLAVRSYSSASS
jgi:ABC-2 type transport system permease protein